MYLKNFDFTDFKLNIENSLSNLELYLNEYLKNIGKYDLIAGFYDLNKIFLLNNNIINNKNEIELLNLKNRITSATIFLIKGFKFLNELTKIIENINLAEFNFFTKEKIFKEMQKNLEISIFLFTDFIIPIKKEIQLKKFLNKNNLKLNTNNINKELNNIRKFISKIKKDFFRFKPNFSGIEI